MKVLHIINSLSTGGAEKLLLESLPLYNKKNIKVDLLLLNGQDTLFLNELKSKECCNIYSLSKGSVYNIFLIFKIIPYLQKYDLIHAHLFPSLYWLSFAKSLSLSSVKILYTEHSTSNNRRNNIILKFFDKFVYMFYFKIVTIADEVDKNLKQHLNFKTTKFKLIKNGVNTKKFNTAKPYIKSKFFSINDVILIQVSSFRVQKDQKTLIESLAKLPSHYKLLLVGDGPLLQKNKELVQHLDLQTRVRFLGTRIDVPRLLKTADIVILSSYHEGLSLSSIEAMASGRPFIASDVPGLREIVKGVGVLFQSENVTELAHQIKQLMDDEKLYNKIVENCIKKASKFDLGTMVDSYIKLYRDVLKID